METLTAELKALEEALLQASKESSGKLTRNLLVVQNRLYTQLESLSWLQRRLAIKGHLPPLRGWAASPDVLLRLHAHVMVTRPRVVVEFGSGASTLVIADALRQNGAGKLISIEHSDYYGAQTMETLRVEQLQDWVDLRIGELEDWEGEHLNPEASEKPSRWYSTALLEGVDDVDFLWVDGPPAATCPYSRYPALPALAKRLSPHAEVWIDDTTRQEEREISERWGADHGFEVEYFQLEKGLGCLTPANPNQTKPFFMTGRRGEGGIANNALQRINSGEAVVLEYGSAYAIDIATEAPDRLVMSVESSLSRARELRHTLSHIKSSAIVFHVDIFSTDPRDMIRDTETSEGFHRYLNEIWEKRFFRDPDVILINGHLRLACLATAMLRIRKPARVLFDDYADDLRYHEVERVVKPARMIGGTAEFELEPNMAQRSDLSFLIRQSFATTLQEEAEASVTPMHHDTQ